MKQKNKMHVTDKDCEKGYVKLTLTITITNDETDNSLYTEEEKK